jgi:hypothetical protein
MRKCGNEEMRPIIQGKETYYRGKRDLIKTRSLLPPY